MFIKVEQIQKNKSKKRITLNVGNVDYYRKYDEPGLSEKEKSVMYMGSNMIVVEHSESELDAIIENAGVSVKN